MTLATGITVFRLATIPILIACLLSKTHDGYLLALIFFVCAVLSDILDGYIARAQQQTTELGALLDALTDKILIHSLLFCLWNLGVYASAIVFCMFFRDMIMDGLRKNLSDYNTPYGTNIWGKGKFSLQAASIATAMACVLYAGDALLQLAANVLLASALIISLPGIWSAATRTLRAVARNTLRPKIMAMGEAVPLHVEPTRQAPLPTRDAA